MKITEIIGLLEGELEARGDVNLKFVGFDVYDYAGYFDSFEIFEARDGETDRSPSINGCHDKSITAPSREQSA